MSNEPTTVAQHVVVHVAPQQDRGRGVDEDDHHRSLRCPYPPGLSRAARLPFLPAVVPAGGLRVLHVRIPPLLPGPRMAYPGTYGAPTGSRLCGQGPQYKTRRPWASYRPEWKPAPATPYWVARNATNAAKVWRQSDGRGSAFGQTQTKPPVARPHLGCVRHRPGALDPLDRVFHSPWRAQP